MATADEIIKNIKSGGSSSGSSGGASSAPSQPSQPTSTVDSIIWQIQNGGKSSAPSTTTSTSEVVDAITTDIKKPRRAGEDLAPTVTLKEQARKAMAGTAAGGDIAKASALANQPLVSTDNYLPTNMGEISDAYQTVFDAILGPKPKDIPLQSTENFLPTNMTAVSNAYQNALDDYIASLPEDTAPASTESATTKQTARDYWGATWIDDLYKAGKKLADDSGLAPGTDAYKQRILDHINSNIEWSANDLGVDPVYATMDDLKYGEYYSMEKGEEKDALREELGIPTFGERVGNIFKAAGAGLAAAYTDAERALYAAGQPGRNEMYDFYIDYWQDTRDNALTTLENYKELYGEEAGTKLWYDEGQDNVLEYAEMMLSSFQTAIEAQPKSTEATAELADQLQQISEEAKQKAKVELNGFENFLVDMGITGVEMASDAAVNLAMGMPGFLGPLAMRSFGSGTQSSRQAGADINQQMLYGAAVASVETLTEKMFDGLSGLYGEGYADEMVEKLLDKVAHEARPEVRAALSLFLGGAEEATEEAVSGRLEPWLKAIYDNGDAIKETYGSLEGYLDSWADTGYSMLVGFAMGFAGSSVDAGKTYVSEKSGTQTEQSSPADALAESAQAKENAGSVSADPAVDTFSEAVDGVMVTSGPNVSESNRKGLAKTLSEKIDMIKHMPEVAKLTGHEMNDRSIKPMQQILDFFHRIGGKVNRANFGDVSLGQYGADAIINHRPLNRAKMVTVEAVPAVIQHGELIAYDPDWKGRGYASYVFAAPVKVAGKTIYVAAVVNQTDGNHFYLNECIDSEGNYVRIAEAPTGTQKSDLPNKNGITEGPDEASAKEGIPDSGTTSSEQTIPQSSAESNNNSDDNNPPPPGGAGDGSVEGADVETRERGESRNIRTDEARDQQLRDFKEENPDIYKVVKNNATLRKALDIFDSQGVEGSAATLEQALADARNGKKLPLEMVPLHKLVCDELAKSGQVERANRISSDLGAELTYAGQLGQANVILRNSSVQAKVDAFAKTVQRLIGENNANVSQEAVDDLINRYRAAETDAERDAIIDDATTAIAQSSPTTLREAFTALRYLNMLGNFKTQGRNLFGNFAMMLSAEAKDRILAISQYAWNAVMRNNQVTQTSSVTTSPRMFGEAWQLFAEDQAEAFGEGKYSDVAQGNKDIRDKKTIFKWNWGENANNWFDEGGLGRKALKFGADLPMNIMEFYRKATSWAMNEGDVIFQKVTYSRVLADYAKAQGYNSLADVPADELLEMRAYAIKQAQEATFHDENAVSNWFSNFDKGFGKGKVLTQGVAPFRQTPANVGVRMEEYSPIGFANTAFEFYKAIHETKDFNAALNSAAKSLTGTGLAALGFMLAKMGKARGKEDDEKLASYEKNVQGVGDYSLVLDDGTTISMDWLQPEAGAFFMGVEAAELCEDGLQADDFMALLGSTTDIALNMSFMSGVNDFIEEIANSKGSQKATPSLLLNAFLKYASQGVTNSLAGQAEQASEQYRQTYYTNPDGTLPTDVQKQLAKLSGKTPGIDYQLADYIDAWGRKQDNGSAGLRVFESFFSPAYINEDRSTEVDDELKRLHKAVGKEIEGSVFPSTAQRSTEIGGVRLSPEEYELYATTGGQKALELVTDFINSEGYEDLDDKTKAETIKKLYGYAKTDAKNAVLEARGEEPVTDSGYERAKAVMKAGKLSWGEYFDIDKNRDMDGNGSPGQEETAQYLFDSGMSDEEAEKVYNVYYPNAKTPYSEWAEGFRTVANSNFSREEYAALTDTITEEKKDKESWDSAGNSAVVDAVLGAVDRGLSDDAAVSLIIDNTSKNYSNPFAALIDDGHSMTEAMDFLGLIDQPGKDGTPPNRSIEQKELIAFYKEHPEEEVLIALVWDSMGYTGKNTKDFATYKGSLK